MKTFISIFLFAAILIFADAYSQTITQQNKQTEKSGTTVSYLSVADVFAQGENLANKTVYVEGTIEHVCKRTGKRFKIVGKSPNQFIKIQLGDKFQQVDSSIIGKKGKVTGKLIPIKMDEKMVLNWEEKMKEKHKNEDNTKHYKEALAFIQNTYNQIKSGKISYYTNYTIEAESYELE
ncbi:MAG: hypothetical protein CO129_11935 [Ignavibacteriales bacterium CG_4_9_14_3_um_filter_34_10]|nr:MAG: hypothetical protein CO129_11935 [Ignavibacteriales bacterium CG_4_9_14_3_um_filter_34_10]